MIPGNSGATERLAARCESATGPDRELDLLIWCATAESHFEYHGGDCVLAVQGGFSARLDWKDMPHPTASLDAAMTLAEPFMLVALSDIAADGLTGCCLCSDTSTNPPTEHWGIPSERGADRQGILARAVTAAALRAHGEAKRNTQHD